MDEFYGEGQLGEGEMTRNDKLYHVCMVISTVILLLGMACGFMGRFDIAGMCVGLAVLTKLHADGFDKRSTK